MNTAQLIQASLGKSHVEKIVVFLGNSGFRAEGERQAPPRGAVATQVLELLLRTCRPAANDVMDPDRTRVHARDAKGAARSYYQSYTDTMASQGKRRRHRRAASASVSLQSPQLWDSERVPDYMGLWCDRLLLGDHQRPVRVAVLEPRVPAALEGDAVQRVVQSHRRHVTRSDVLLVRGCTDLPFGIVRQGTFPPAAAAAAAASGSGGGGDGGGAVSLTQALMALPPGRDAATPAASCASLLVGIGDAAGTREPFTAAEERRLRQCLLPLSAFGCALWAANPARSAAYLAEQTPHAAHLTAQNANLRLWENMQAAMLSTRDAALLRAHFGGEMLDARLSAQQQLYLAETLLARLEEREGGSRRGGA